MAYRPLSPVIRYNRSISRLLRQHRMQQEAERALLGIPLKEEDLIFARPVGSPLDPSTVHHTFQRILRRAGIKSIRFHDLRHSHATLLLEAGVNPKVVSERLGHSSVAFTLDTYGHVMSGMQEDAAERLDRLILPEIMGSEDVVKMLSKRGDLNVSRTGIEPVTC